MKKTTILAVCVALIGATSAVKASFITGSLSVGGSAIFDSTTISTSTSVTGWDAPYAGARGTGDFSSVLRFSSINLAAPWSYDSGNLAGFITFDGFTFDLDKSYVTARPPGIGGGVTVYGYGLLSGNGYDATAFSWTFSSTGVESGSPLEDTFQGTLVALPDGGTTVALLGGALTALGLIRRKLVA